MCLNQRPKSVPYLPFFILKSSTRNMRVNLVTSGCICNCEKSQTCAMLFQVQVPESSQNQEQHFAVSRKKKLKKTDCISQNAVLQEWGRANYTGRAGFYCYQRCFADIASESTTQHCWQTDSEKKGQGVLEDTCVREQVDQTRIWINGLNLWGFFYFWLWPASEQRSTAMGFDSC